MNQILATNKTYVAEHWRVDYRNAILGQLPERQQKLRGMPFLATVNRLHPDWFALRLWEDDGGGHNDGAGRENARQNTKRL